MPLTSRIRFAARNRTNVLAVALTTALVVLTVGGSDGPVRPGVPAALALPAAGALPPALPAAGALPPALPAARALPHAPALPDAPGAAVPAVPALPAVSAGFRWPLDGHPPVVRRFAPPPRPWLPGHRGVDLSADPGAPVYAAGPGTVRFAGLLAGRGVVSIDHADGLRTTYEPVTPVVAAGQQVRAGDIIGTLGAGHPGCPAVSCLHWGLRRGEVYLDPLALVGAARVRLLPLTLVTP